MRTTILVFMLAGVFHNPANAQINFDSWSDFKLTDSIAAQDLDIPTPEPEKAPKDSSASCEGYPLTMELRDRSVTLPATGVWTLESHLATDEDSFANGRAFPRTITENISDHISSACTLLAQVSSGANCGEVYDTEYAKEWTPPENGKAGQGSVGNVRPSKAEEMWIFNMMWAGNSIPKAGTKFLATYNDKSVVVVGGYERGPSSAHFLGGFQREVLWALGAEEDSSEITLSALIDQTLPPGPVNCPK